MTRKDVETDKTQAAHSIFRVADKMGWDLGDSSQFLAKLKNVEYGLSAETEFGALLIWLRSCVLVHGLDQDGLTSATNRIPDLFAVFQRDGVKMSALIEVKTTKKSRLAFRRDYLDALIKYSRILGHQLLIAWKPLELNVWTLFDPDCGKWEGDRWLIDGPTAFKNDLMGLVADEFYAAPYKGPYLELSGPIIETERNRAGKTKGMSYRIDEAAFLDRDGVELEKMPEPVLALLYSTIEPVVDVNERTKRITTRYFVQDTLVPSQKLLRMLVGTKFKDDDRIRWREVAKQMDNVTTRQQLRNDLKAALGEHVKYIFRMLPSRVPEYIPQEWRSKAKRK